MLRRKKDSACLETFEYHMIDLSLGYKIGAIAHRKSAIRSNSPMKLILPQIYLRGHDLPAIVACGHSEQVHGILTRTCRRNIEASLDLKTSSA